MTEYERGFLEKCAEFGIDDETSQGLLKQAFLPLLAAAIPAVWGASTAMKSGRQDAELRKRHQEALRKAYAGGYDKYMPRYAKPGNMPGTWLGRTFRRMFHGASGFADSYQSELDRAMDEARGKWQQAYNEASPEARKYMREEILQRRKQYDAEELDKIRAANPLGAAEIDRQKAEAGKASPAAPMTRDQFTRNEALRRNFKHNYSHVRFNETNGRWEPIDGYGLPNRLQMENAHLDKAWEDYQTGLKNQPAKPAEPPKPGPLNAPKATW